MQAKKPEPGSSVKNAQALAAALAASSFLFFLSALTVGYADVKALAAIGGLGLLAIFLNEIVFRGFLQPRLGVWAASAANGLAYPLLMASSAQSYAALALFSFAFSLVQGMLKELHGLKACLASAAIYASFLFLRGETFSSSIPLALFFLAAPVYFALEKKNGLKELGLHFEGALGNFFIGIATVLAAFLLMFVIAMAAYAVGLNDQEKVAEKINLASPLVLVTAVALSPLAEEVFFRGVLSRKAGVLLSSALFAAAHYGYGSVTEVAGAFAIGLLLALVFKKTGSLVAPVTAHTILNLVSILAMTRGIA